MRQSDVPALSSALEPKLGQFVRDSRCRLALLMSAGGQILLKHGFSRGLDLGGVATLAAGIHASSRALAEMLGQSGFEHLHQGSGENQVFIGSSTTPVGDLILVSVFGTDTSIGLVRVFFETFSTGVSGMDVWRSVHRSESGTFEQDLETGLDRIRDVG